MQARVVLRADIPGPLPGVEEHLDAVMEHLCALEGDVDPTIELDLGAGQVRVLVSVEADSDVEAIATASRLLADALTVALTQFPEGEGIRTRSVGPVLVDA